MCPGIKKELEAIKMAIYQIKSNDITAIQETNQGYKYRLKID